MNSQACSIGEKLRQACTTFLVTWGISWGFTFAAAALEEVVVTAQKREQTITDVGLTMTAISGDVLSEKKISTLEDFGHEIQGLYFSRSSTNTPILTLRGVGFNESSLGVYPAASLYLDEAPLPFPAMAAHSAYDLERVEVLKGPQGTMFGQNSTAGAINFIAAKPTDTLAYGGDISYGRFDRKEFNAFVSGPLGEKMGARLSVASVDADEWQKSNTRNDKLGEESYIAGRLLVSFAPTETAQFSLNVNGWIDQSDPQAQQLAGIRPNEPPFVKTEIRNASLSPQKPRVSDWSPSIRSKGDRDFFQVILRGDIDLNESLTLTSLTSYSQFNQVQVSDGDGLPAVAWDLEKNDGELESFFTELRLANSADASLRWLIGINYEKSSSFEDQILRYGDNSNSNPNTLFINASGVTLDQDIENYAIFANSELDFASSFTFKAGIRYTDSSVKAETCSYSPGDGAVANLFNILGAILGAVPFNPIGPADCYTLNENLVPGELFEESLDEDNISWRVGLDYRLNDNVLFYGNVSEGYKTGSFPALAAATFEQLQPVVQESVLAFEPGVKASFADGIVQLNAAGFYYKYDDKQVRAKILDQVFGILDTLINVPKSNVFGAEVDLTVRATEGLTLSGGATYLNSEIDKYSGVNIVGLMDNFKGDDLPFAPEFAYAINADYRMPLGAGGSVFIGVGVNGQTKSSALPGGERVSFPDTPLNKSLSEHPYEIDGYTLVHARVGYEWVNGWKIMVWGKNITDEYYWTNVMATADTTGRLTGIPATYGITLSFSK